MRRFLKRVDVFVYVIKLLCYSVQIYKCIPGIYVITRVFELKEFIVCFHCVGVCRDRASSQWWIVRGIVGLSGWTDS